MWIPPETLLDGAMRTLREEVLPDVGSAYARGQLWAVVDVLNNLRDRVEVRRAFARADAAAAREALGAAAGALREHGAADAAAALERELEAAPGDDAEGAPALRSLVTRTLAALDEAPAPAREPAHAALRGYLVAQAVRDLSALKPSLLSQISRG